MRSLLLMALALVACESAPPQVAAVRQGACGTASDETLRVMQGLTGPCAGCHTSGARGYFASPAAFQALIVADPAVVIPGDPDNSELVRLLEGRGTGAFARMPIGDTTYAQLVATGAATLTIADVRAWIAGLATQARSARPDPSAPRVTRLNAAQLQRSLYLQLGLTHDDFFISARDFGIARAETRSDDLAPVQPPDALPAPRQLRTAERALALGAGHASSGRRSDTTITSSFALTLTEVSQRWCRLALAKSGNVALFPQGTTRSGDEANVRATIGRWSLHFLGRRATTAEVADWYTTVWAPLARGPAPNEEAGWVGLCSAFIRSPEYLFY
jgi:hypothetical protein